MQIDVNHIASFREIHKNAWLKRISQSNANKLLPGAQKKAALERWWTVFCIHGDTEPFLEGYSDSGGAAITHVPRWRTPLTHTLHVSGSVGPARPHTEYEFVITLQEGVVRLVAPTWESMQDWVDTLRNKLREMKILSPKENVYSKGPEQIKPRAPTRDPTSPLPAPPPGPQVRVPGTEPSLRPLSASSAIANESRLHSHDGLATSDPAIYSNQDHNDNIRVSNNSSIVINHNQSNSSHDGTTTTIETPADNSLSNVNLNQSEPSSDDATNRSNTEESPSNKYTSNTVISVTTPVNSNENSVTTSNNRSRANSESSECTLTVSRNQASPDTSNVNLIQQCESYQSSDKNEDHIVDYDPNGIKNNSEMFTELNIQDENSIISVQGVGLANAVDFMSKNRSGDNCLNLSAAKNQKFTSAMANVSGMNICLVDSVLEQRMKTEADKDLFMKFDSIDDSQPSTSAGVPNRIFIPENEEVTAKYSKVCLKTKSKHENSSNAKSFPMTENLFSTQLGQNSSDQIFQKSSKSPSNVKPKVLPRTIIFNDTNKGISLNKYDRKENDSHQKLKSEWNSTFADTNSKLQKPEKPPIAERTIIPHSIPASNETKSREIPSRSSVENNSPNEISNVTIISVTNDSAKKLNTDINHHSQNNPDIDSIFLEGLRKSFSHNYVNIPIETNNKIFVGDLNCGKTNAVDNMNSDLENSNTSGYGHIKHSFTTDIKNEKNHNANDSANRNANKTSDVAKAISIFSNNFADAAKTNEGSACDIGSNNLKRNDFIKIKNINEKNVVKNDTSSAGRSQKVMNVSKSSINCQPYQNTESCVSTVEITTSGNNVYQNNTRAKSDEFYESVFTPFTISSVNNSADNVTSDILTTQMNRKPILDKKIRDNIKQSSEYEFLSWNESRNTQINEPSTSHSISHVVLQNNDNEINNTSDEGRSNLELPTEVRSIEINDNNISNVPSQNSVVSNSKSDETEKNNSKNIKHGLFTRGLTEFSIMSKFRNIGHSNSSRSPLLKNSQFYSYEDVDPLQGTSSSTDPRPNQENVKKNTPFSDKLNNIFNKIGEDKKAVGKTSDKTTRVESTLRRNWSEHNDRTVLPVVKHFANMNIYRSRMKNDDRTSAQKSTPNNASIKEERQIRRRSSSLSESRSNTENTPSASEALKTSLSNIPAENNTSVLLRPMGLREQQVARLRGEMAHVGGVRLRLRSGDCPSEAMALADVYGTVWICGWKQRTHPLLYNALHIGDRLATVRGVPITSVRQAKRALKDTSSGLQYVELIVKRLPHGRVYSLKKDSDMQELGLIMDCATVVGVIPGSPAAKGGIPSKGTITEVNGRPVNLLLKKGDTQVRDRLNAIGREVSILIQPTEFVTLLRTALRNIRGHKDYIVQ